MRRWILKELVRGRRGGLTREQLAMHAQHAGFDVADFEHELEAVMAAGLVEVAGAGGYQTPETWVGYLHVTPKGRLKLGRDEGDAPS
jgi:hypothetical protein